MKSIITFLKCVFARAFNKAVKAGIEVIREEARPKILEIQYLIKSTASGEKVDALRDQLQSLRAQLEARIADVVKKAVGE